MLVIKIKIIKFISEIQPDFVECIFIDAWNNLHFVQDKVHIVTKKYLDANSNYPQDGVIACEIVKEWKNSQGQKIFTVNTSKPWGVDTTDGLTQITH
jgi:hypothetical protein